MSLSRLASPRSHNAIRAAVGAGAGALTAETPVGQALVEIGVWFVHAAGLPEGLVGPMETLVTAATIAFCAAALAWLGSTARDATPEEPSTLSVKTPIKSLL